MITVTLKDENVYARESGLWQFDFGQRLRIEGIDISEVTEIDFSLKSTGSESIPMVAVPRGGGIEVEIPDSLLAAKENQDYFIYAFIYLIDGDSGETTRRITLDVKARPGRKGKDPGSDPDPFAEVIKEIRDAASRAEGAVVKATEAADDIKESREQIVTNKIDITTLQKDIDKLEEGFTIIRKDSLLNNGSDIIDGYNSSTFSGWVMHWKLKESGEMVAFSFIIKGRTDKMQNVTKVRARIAIGECSDSNVVFDKMVDVSVDSASGEEKEVIVQVPSIDLVEGTMIHILLQADAICIFKMCDTLSSSETVAYSVGGRMDGTMDSFNRVDGGKYRLYIKAILFDSTTPKLADSAVTTPKLADGAVTIEKQTLIKSKIGSNNIIDMESALFAVGEWWWVSTGIGSTLELQKNQYTNNMKALKIPIDALKENITVSYRETGYSARSWFMVTDDMTILSKIDSPIKKDLYYGLTVAIPENAKYFCLSVEGSAIPNLMVNYGTEILPYEEYREVAVVLGKEIPSKELIKQWIDEEKGDQSSILKLPRKFDLLVGDTFEMFYKGITNCLNSDLYDYEISFSDSFNRGKAWKRKWEWTPVETDVGTKTMTVTAVDNIGKEIDKKTVSIVVHNRPSNPSNEKIILCVGDSLTNSGIWCSELRRRMIASDGNPTGYGLTNIKFIGTKENSDGCKYEGYGGWTFKSYLSSMKSNDYMIIHGSFDKVDADQHSVYYDSNGVRWKLETIGNDVIKLIRVNGAAVLAPSGRLIWESGGVTHTDIVYTSSEQAIGNPFWDESANKNNFTAYASRMGVSKIDHCIILLGWNDTGASEASYKTNAKKFIDGIRAEYPNCKITLLGLQVPSRDGFANNYGISWKYYNKLQSVWNLNQWYQDIADEYNDIDFVNISGQFDTENNHSIASFYPNTRNPNKVTLQSNGVHPYTYGYLQIADAVFRNICSRL